MHCFKFVLNCYNSHKAKYKYHLILPSKKVPSKEECLVPGRSASKEAVYPDSGLAFFFFARSCNFSSFLMMSLRYQESYIVCCRDSVIWNSHLHGDARFVSSMSGAPPLLAPRRVGLGTLPPGADAVQMWAGAGPWGCCHGGIVWGAGGGQWGDLGNQRAVPGPAGRPSLEQLP